MRSSFVIPAALAAIAVANPLPQDFDWDAIDGLDPIPSVSIPIVDPAAQATTVAYTPAVAASTISAAIVASGTSAADDTSAKKRGVEERGAAPTSTDTPEYFLANPVYSSAAVSAPVPTGYTQQFSNLNASNNAYGYMGYTVLSQYDTTLCASKCNAIDGCASFNLYFERDPSVTPTDSNSNPSSVVNIKCVFWGGPVTTENAVNVGQYQDDFHVVIAGSNGYLNNTIAPVTGYTEPNYLGNAAINAPLDCNNHDTYMGVKIWTTGPFDASKCAAACTSTSVWDLAHGFTQTCQFFNTYLLLKNGTAVGQYCAMYNETWADSYATNVGQYRGANHYTISHSYSYSNITDPGCPTCKK